MSQRIWTKCMVAAGLAILFAGLAQAADGAVAADTFVASTNPSTNYGGLSNLHVSSSTTTLIEFDLSSLPAGTTSSQISKATLRLYVNRVNTYGLVNVLPVMSAWSESTVTYATIPTLNTAVTSFTPTIAQQFVLIDITPLVQGWITTPSGNYGFALASTAGDMLFDSKENDETSHAAQLDITVVSQGPQGVAGAQGATGASGAAGAPGIPGAAGTPGTVGATGTTGAAGAAGATGATGPPVNFRNAWSNSAAYAVGDAVSENGSSYIALLANTDINPATDVSGSGGHWALLAAEGAVGAAGSQGIQGATGAIGVTGSQGIQGPTGAVGATGSQGIQGASGAVGATGATGTTGATGAAGPTGPPVNFRNAWNSSATYAVGDAVSENGSSYIALLANTNVNPVGDISGSGGHWAILAAEGATGAAGSQGVQGPIGATGATGSQGLQGTTGAAGATGSQGLQGAAGATGATGSQGLQGATGAMGATGSQGIQGATGAAGATGATGTAGSNGAAATVTIGTTTTGAAGTSASVTNSGSTSAAVFNFTIPQGAAGSGGGSTTGIPFTTVSRSIGVSEYFNPVQALVAISSPADNIFTWVAEQCTIPSVEVYSKYSEALIVDLQYNTSGSGSATTSLGLACSVAANGSGCTGTGPVTVNAGTFLIFYITQSGGTAPAGTGTLWTAFTCTPGA
jgi:hypothetical protein